MQNQLNVQTRAEGVFTENESIQPQMLTLDGCTNQKIGFVFSQKTFEPAQLCGTVRVDYCRTVPIAVPLTVELAIFSFYEEICGQDKARLIKTASNDGGIQLIPNAQDGAKHDSVVVSFSETDTPNLPEEMAWKLILKTTEYGLRVWAWGSVMIRPCAPTTQIVCPE